MSYKHGVYVVENATSVSAPVASDSGLIVVVGTAPVHLAEEPAAVNTPVLVNSFAEAVMAFGDSTDFAKYTICEAVHAAFQVVGAGPMVIINVLDPEKHVKVLAETTVQVNGGAAVLEEPDAILSQLVVKNDAAALTEGTDYIADFDKNGNVKIALLEGGAAAEATSLKVSGKAVDPAAVTEEDIVGGVDATTGKETGIEAVRMVYPMLGMVPGTLIAPGYSQKPAVAAALQAKTLAGGFRMMTMVDVDSGESGAKKYTDVKAKKEVQELSDANCFALWPCAKVGEQVYHLSAIAAAVAAKVDAENGGVPYVSVDNQPVGVDAACLEDGTEVLLDREQANEVNACGVATMLNMNGMRLWGNNTAAYPESKDYKDRWMSVRRFLNWDDNTFIQTYFSKVSMPMNRRLVESIVDGENVRGNSFVARGICARHETKFLEEENPTGEMLNGTLTFHKYVTPFGPAEDIEEIVEIDPDALASALA